MSEGPLGGRASQEGYEAPSPPPPSRPPSPSPPRAPGGLASSVTWILGVALIVFLAVVTLNTVRTESPGSKGLKVGSKLPPFAAPLVASSLKGDASVAVKAR